MTAKKKDLTSELIDDILSDESSYGEDDGILSPELKAEIAKSSEDKTVRIENDDPSNVLDLPTASSYQEQPPAPRKVVMRHHRDKLAVRSNTGVRSSMDAHLIQSENLKVAQDKIFELEDEISRLRTENEKLVAAGEALRTENETLSSEAESKTNKLLNLKETIDQEREVFDVSSKAKDRELKDLRVKMQEFEQRLTTNIQKIRVRERELENRLELVKMENAALTRNKDEMLLDLKRQIDHLNMEIGNYRGKSQQLNKQMTEQHDVLRKTVKALRLALSMLEGQFEDEAS